MNQYLDMNTVEWSILRLSWAVARVQTSDGTWKETESPALILIRENL